MATKDIKGMVEPKENLKNLLDYYASSDKNVVIEGWKEFWRFMKRREAIQTLKNVDEVIKNAGKEPSSNT